MTEGDDDFYLYSFNRMTYIISGLGGSLDGRRVLPLSVGRRRGQHLQQNNKEAHSLLNVSNSGKMSTPKTSLSSKCVKQWQNEYTKKMHGMTVTVMSRSGRFNLGLISLQTFQWFHHRYSPF